MFASGTAEVTAGRFTLLIGKQMVAQIAQVAAEALTAMAQHCCGCCEMSIVGQRLTRRESASPRVGTS